MGAGLWGGGDDSAHQVAVDEQGSIFLTGHFSDDVQFGTNAQTSIGGRDTFLARLRYGGEVDWVLGTGAEYDDFGVSVVPDGAGGAFFSGRYQSIVEFDAFSTSYVTQPGSTNPLWGGYIVHLDVNGVTRWLTEIQRTSDPTKMVQGPDGSLYLHGALHANTDLGIEKPSPGSRCTDDYFAKISRSGEILWAHPVGAYNGSFQAFSMVVDQAENIYLGASFHRSFGCSGDDPLHPHLPGYQPFKGAQLDVADRGLIIAKFNASGDFIWVKSAGIPIDFRYSEFITDMELSPNGKIYFTGMARHETEFDGRLLPVRGDSDLLVGELAASREIPRVAHWRFDRSNSRFVYDALNSFPAEMSSGVASVPGISTNGLSLESALGGTVLIDNFPEMSGRAFSLVASVKLAPGAANHMVIMSRHDMETSAGFILGLNGMGTNDVPGRVFFTDTGRFADAIVSTNEVFDGRWHLLVATYDPHGNKSLYVDGRLQGTVPAQAFPVVCSPLVGGGIGVGLQTNAMFDGTLDELLIYDRALSQAEVDLQVIFPHEPVLPGEGNRFEWVRTLTASGAIQAEATATDSQGNVYLTGWFEGSIEADGNNINSAGRADMFLAKFAASGDLLWLQQGGGSVGEDAGMALAVDSQDNVVVGGYFGGTAFFGGLTVDDGPSGLTSDTFGGSASGRRFGLRGFVAKYSAQGAILFLQPTWSGVNAVALDSRDEIYCGGTGILNREYHGTHLLSAGGLDLWVARFNTVGHLVWGRSFGSPSDEGVTALVVDSQDRVFIAGNHQRSLTLGNFTVAVPAGSSVPQPFVAALENVQGNPIWAVGGTATTAALAQDLLVDGHGLLQLVGSCTNLLEFGLVSVNPRSSAHGGFRVALDPANGLAQSGSSYLGEAKGIATYGLDNLFVSSRTVGVTDVAGQELNALGGADVLMIHESEIDGIESAIQVGSRGDDDAPNGHGLTVDEFGNRIIAGSTEAGSGLIRFDTRNQISAAQPTAWLAKIASGVGIRRPPVDEVATNLYTASFRVLPRGEPPLSVQWYFNGTNLLSGSTNVVLNFTNIADLRAGHYHVVVTNHRGRAISPAAELFVELPPLVVTQPVDLTVTESRPAPFIVRVAGPGPFSYQWYLHGGAIPDATNASFEISEVASGDTGSYWVEIANPFGTTVSDTAVLQVVPPGILPLVFEQPQSASKAIGSFHLFSVDAAGQPPLFYQWFVDGNPLIGRRKSTLGLFNLQPSNAGPYHVVVSNNLGAVTSSVANLDVFVPQSPIITNAPQPLTVTSGADAEFFVGVVGSPPLRYQWLHNNATIPGATNQVLQLSNVLPAAAGNYRVQIFNDSGVTTSDNALLSVLQAPFITIQPRSVTVSNGQPAVLQSVIGGRPAPAVQWHRDHVRLVDGTEYLGVSTPSLNILSAQVPHVGSYFLTLSNALGTVTSAPAALLLNFPPRILEQPTSVTRPSGAMHVFGVGVTGAPPMTLQWFFQGEPLPGELRSSLTLSNLARSHSGHYSVAINNASGSLISSNAFLRVLVPQRIQPPLMLSNRLRFVFGEADGAALAASNSPAFQVQFTTNFLSWRTLSNALQYTNGQMAVEDALTPADRRRFYRILEP